MRVVALVSADMERGPLGQASRLAEPLAAVPVLARTVQRLGRCRRLDAVAVLVPALQAKQAQAIVSGLATIVAVSTERKRFDLLPVVGRKWAMTGWRGGVGGMTIFDEQLDAAAMAQAGQQLGADVIVHVPAHAPLVDPVLIDELVEHHRQFAHEMRFTFSQAAPGLAGAVYNTELLEDMARTGEMP